MKEERSLGLVGVNMHFPTLLCYFIVYNSKYTKLGERLCSIYKGKEEVGL